MDYYRCENPDCGFVAEEEPDICPRCGGTFFTARTEDVRPGYVWVCMVYQAVEVIR